LNQVVTKFLQWSIFFTGITSQHKSLMYSAVCISQFSSGNLQHVSYAHYTGT